MAEPPATSHTGNRALHGAVFFFVALILLALAGWYGGRWYLARSVADYNGEATVAGLDGPVEITFDAKGIPQVWAQTDADAYFALGWLHASERLFQMELIRRMAHGTLAEVFGAVAFDIDARQRRIGFARLGTLAETGLTDTTRAHLDAYTRGINAWTAQAPVLPPEFVLLGFDPAPWQPFDCTVIAAFQTWFSHTLMDRDGDFNTIANRFGDQLADLLNDLKPWSPATVPDDFLGGLFEHDPFPLRMTKASNSWVVAPEKSASGAALHASDPHLAINEVPGLWYLAGLHSEEGLNILGVTAPGLPAVSMGHNGFISYAFTVAPVDLVDYYVETFQPGDSLQVLTPDGFQPMTRRVEDVQVKGEAQPREVTIYHTPRGLLVEHSDTTGLSMHWSGFDLVGSGALESMFALHRAHDFEAFRRIVTRLQPLSVNWTYADREGNIGYQLGTAIPRRNYNTFVRHNAADTTVRWNGYYGLEATPYAYNPAQGWLATTNNQPVHDDDAPVPVPGFYNLHRIERATALLSEQATFTRADMERMQLDRTSGLAVRWKSLAADGARRLGRFDLERAFRDWDGHMAEDDTLAALFTLWWYNLARPLFEDDLGDDWDAGFWLQEAVLARPGEITPIDDRRTLAIESSADIAARALETAYIHAGGRTLGETQTLTITHPLAQAPLLERWLRLNRGPFPEGGDSGTLNATFNYYDTYNNVLYATVGPSMRFVMDWADVDSFTIQLPLGQSGNPFSPHYDDFLDFTRRGDRWNVPFSRAQVYARRTGMLRLLPAS